MPTRQVLLVVGIALANGCLLIAWGRTGVAGPLVQRLTPDGFTVTWSMPERATDVAAELRVLEPVGQLIETFPANIEDGRYVAVASGLTPGVRYRYEIACSSGDEAEWILVRGTARTAPPAGEPFRFIAFGDSGSGKWAQHRLARVMDRFNPDLLVHTGDLLYSEEHHLEDLPHRFFEPYRPLLARAAFYLAVGNHEYGMNGRIPVLDTLILPTNGPVADNPVSGAGHQWPEHNYWFDYGDVRFVALDSNLSYDALKKVVAPWLDQVLDEADNKWKIVFFHHPFYTHARHKPTYRVRQTIIPIIDRHRVDLVITGHNHLYERTHPIRDGRRVPDGHGTVHVTSGAAGATLYKAKRPAPDFMAFQCDSEHSFTIIDVTPSLLKLRQIGETGGVLDEYEIRRPRTFQLTG